MNGPVEPVIFFFYKISNTLLEKQKTKTVIEFM